MFNVNATHFDGNAQNWFIGAGGEWGGGGRQMQLDDWSGNIQFGDAIVLMVHNPFEQPLYLCIWKLKHTCTTVQSSMFAYTLGPSGLTLVGAMHAISPCIPVCLICFATAAIEMANALLLLLSLCLVETCQSVCTLAACGKEH